MSTHKDCGEQIRWARRPDSSGWYPPLEYAGEAFIITRGEDNSGDSFGAEVYTYRIHRCDPDKMEAWQEYCVKMTDLQGEAPPDTPYTLMRERDRELAWKEAVKKPCPKCEAPKNSRCKSLGHHVKKKEKETGEITETRWPHPERWTKAS